MCICYGGYDSRVEVVEVVAAFVVYSWYEFLNFIGCDVANRNSIPLPRFILKITICNWLFLIQQPPFLLTIIYIIICICCYWAFRWSHAQLNMLLLDFAHVYINLLFYYIFHLKTTTSVAHVFYKIL